MGKHLKNDNSSSSHKSGWLVGMLHVLDFHHWRTKNRPICFRTPRTQSLVREQEPFLDSKNKDSKILSVVTEIKPKKQQKHMMTTKHVTDYVDFLEILRKEDVFVKILTNPNSKFGKQVQIKSNPRILPKSGSFPPVSRPAKIEHKQNEYWYAPNRNGTVLTWNVPPIETSSNQGNNKKSSSHDHGFNHAVVNGFREIKKFLKNALRDGKKKKKYSTISKNDSLWRYSHLLEKSFSRRDHQSGELRSKSLRVSYEDRKSVSGDSDRPRFFRRVSSLSGLEVLGSFLSELSRDSSCSNQETRRSIDKDTKFEPKKSQRGEKEEEKDEEKEHKRSQETHLDITNQRIIHQEDPNSVSRTDFSEDFAIKEETLLSQGMFLNQKIDPLMSERLNSIETCSASLGLTLDNIYNYEEDVEEEEEDEYFCYVKKVLEHSGFLEEDNGGRWHSKEQPLDPSLLYELGIQEEAMNKELLFDLVNEAITESHNQSQIYFPKTYLNRKSFLDEVWGRVEWSLYGLGDENRDRSLDDIVGKDLIKCDGWMNLRSESNWLILEVEDMIFDEVLDEMLCGY